MLRDFCFFVSRNTYCWADFCQKKFHGAVRSANDRRGGLGRKGGKGARLKIPKRSANWLVGEKRADEAKTGQKRRGKTQKRAAGPQKTITRFTGPPPQASECLLRLKKKAVENTWCLYVIYIRYASKKWKKRRCFYIIMMWPVEEFFSPLEEFLHLQKTHHFTTLKPSRDINSNDNHK